MNGKLRTCYEYYGAIGNTTLQAKYDGTAVSGSETNPYAIEDVFDWIDIGSGYTITINNTGPYYPCFELLNDIDMNDCNVQTIESSVISSKFYFSKIEGNGHSIRNLFAILQNVYHSGTDTEERIMMKNGTKSSMMDGKSIINNLNFINIIRYDSFVQLFGANSSSPKLIFNNCNFTIYDYNRNGTIFNANYHGLQNTNYYAVTYNYCTFNIKTSMLIKGGNNAYEFQDILSDYKTTFNYCHINMEYLHGVNPYGIINHGIYNFSYITITINYLGQDDFDDNHTYNLFKIGKTINKCNYNLRGSYIYIKIKSNSTSTGPYLKVGVAQEYYSIGAPAITPDNVSSFDIINNVSVPSFITIEDENKDNPNKALNIDEFTQFVTEGFLDGDGVYSIGAQKSSLYYLTPENAKNYDVLSAIDFPCLKVN